MLQAQHNSRTYAVSNFNIANESFIELVSKAYKRVNGWELGDSTLEGFPADEILEIIDRVRIPLAVKKIDGEDLSVRDENYLLMTEILIDKILNSMVPIPEESAEVKSAMLHAKRILKRV